MQTTANVLSALISSAPAAPLASQSDLSDFDQAKESQSVVGDDSDANLSTEDGASQIASPSSDAGKDSADAAQSPQDDPTTGNLKAAIAQVQQASANLEAMKLDPATQHDVELEQYYAQLDAQSKTDAQLFKDAVPDALKKMLGIPDPDADPSIEDLKDAYDDVKEMADGRRNPFNGPLKIPSPSEGFFKAYQPSFTAGPSMDMPPPFSPERQQQIDDQVKQLMTAQEQYARALRALQDAFLQYEIAHPPYMSAQPAPTGPQIVKP
jgi:hypothetical protein